MSDRPQPLAIVDISTCWSAVHEPSRFVMRYATAIRRYLLALLHDPSLADDATQEFLLRVQQSGFANAAPDRGRFRYYLLTSVRNSAHAVLAKQHRERKTARLIEEALPADREPDALHEYLKQWRECAIESAWQDLERQQEQTPGNLGHTILRLSVAHPDADSDELSVMLREQGHDLTAAAVRKQRSRARERFALALIHEVASTLSMPSREEIEDELCETGLMQYVRKYWPLPLASP